MAALAGVTRTEHAIVGEVYAPGDDADYALGRITCIAHHWSVTDEIRSPIWSGICATTTNTCARGPAGASTAAR